MQQTISEAARLYSKARSTIHRAIENNRLSCSFRYDGVKVIDQAELIKLWGEPPNQSAQTQQNATHQAGETQQELLHELRTLREEVRLLREEMQRVLPPTVQEPSKKASKKATPKNFTPSNQLNPLSFADIEKQITERIRNQS